MASSNSAGPRGSRKRAEFRHLDKLGVLGTTPQRCLDFVQSPSYPPLMPNKKTVLEAPVKLVKKSLTSLLGSSGPSVDCNGLDPYIGLPWP
jgi:hypothetical protein